MLELSSAFFGRIYRKAEDKRAARPLQKDQISYFGMIYFSPLKIEKRPTSPELFAFGAILDVFI